MSAALHLYEQLSEATDDKTRARLIAEAFDALETRFAQITDLSTQGQVRETELLLQKEVREVEGRLQQEIKRLDLKISEVEGRLKKRSSRSSSRSARSRAYYAPTSPTSKPTCSNGSYRPCWPRSQRSPRW